MSKDALMSCAVEDSEEEPVSGEGRLAEIRDQFKTMMIKQRSQLCTEQKWEEPRQRESGVGRPREEAELLREAKGHNLRSSKLWMGERNPW